MVVRGMHSAQRRDGRGSRCSKGEGIGTRAGLAELARPHEREYLPGELGVVGRVGEAAGRRVHLEEGRPPSV